MFSPDGKFYSQMELTICRDHSKSHARLVMGAVGRQDKNVLLDFAPSIGTLKLSWHDGPELYVQVAESAIVRRYGPYDDLPRVVVASPGSERLGVPGFSSAPIRPIAGAQSFDLSDSEIARLSTASEAGSADAAYRLGMYYDFVKLDSASANQYMERSAKLGSVQAQVYLGAKLVQSKDSNQHQEGLTWLKRAASSGDKNAQEILSEAKEVD
jgi:hypothetical protein